MDIDGNIDVSSLPDEVTIEIFNKMYESTAADMAQIGAAFNRSADRLSKRFGEYVSCREDGSADFDFAKFGKDMLDVACVISGVVDGSEGESCAVGGAELFAAIAYMWMSMDVGHGHIRGTRGLAKQIDESIDIYNSVPQGMRESPLVYMQRMSQFRDEVGGLEL